MALSALTICAENPVGRKYLMGRRDDIKALLGAKEPLVHQNAKECLEVIEWTP
jgi:hypothetical protein